jgi:hypothetical protein
MNFAQVVLWRLGSDAEVPELTNADYDTVFAFHMLGMSSSPTGHCRTNARHRRPIELTVSR